MNVNSLSDFSVLSDPTQTHVRVSLNKRPGRRRKVISPTG